MATFVLDRHQRPLMPCSEKRARLLLSKGRARVHRIHPFTIRLIDRTVEESALQLVALKVDPGAKVTGLALVRVEEGPMTVHHVLHVAELSHRCEAIKLSMRRRAMYRRRRRSVLRYRPQRSSNRKPPEDWLPPSLEHLVNGIATLASRYACLVPITAVHAETVRFDTQVLMEADGEAPQDGLRSLELWEYLLERDGHACVYCGSRDSLEKDHLVPRSRGGSDRVSNQAVACRACNQAKGSQTVGEFLRDRPEVLESICAHRRVSRSAASAVNSTRKVLLKRLDASCCVRAQAWTGSRTKWNRVRLGLPKSHVNDAACVGLFDSVVGCGWPVLLVSSSGRGGHQRTTPDSHGFPRSYLPHSKSAFGFRTGDLVRAAVPKGKKAGVHIGRVTIRNRGYFRIDTVDGISWKHCKLLQRADGYGYRVAKSL